MVAHCPALGVKVYVPDAVLLIVAGFHVPLIPLVEVAGSAGANVPLQKGAIGLNKGVTVGVTVTVIVTGTAHCPALGVKV